MPTWEKKSTIWKGSFKESTFRATEHRIDEDDENKEGGGHRDRLRHDCRQNGTDRYHTDTSAGRKKVEQVGTKPMGGGSVGVWGCRKRKRKPTHWTGWGGGKKGRGKCGEKEKNATGMGKTE